MHNKYTICILLLMIASYNCKFTGYYENHSNGRAVKNGESFFTVTKTNTTYTWKNANGVKCTLHPYDNDYLRVARDCIYYKHGFTYAMFTAEGVTGPKNKFFKREVCTDRSPSCLPSDCTNFLQKGECALTCNLCTLDFTGYYENHIYDNRGKTSYHYVNITQNVDGKSFTWKNAAGLKWTLYSHGGNTLRVGKDCPYYERGYKYVQYNSDGLFGPRKEFYSKEACCDRLLNCKSEKCNTYNMETKGDCARTCRLCDATSNSQNTCLLQKDIALAQKYAPIVHLAAYERFYPSGVDYFLREVSVRNGPSRYILTSKNIPTCDKYCFLETRSSPSCGACIDVGMFRGQTPRYAQAYAMVNKHGEGITDVFYWFFFPFNQGKQVCKGITKEYCPCYEINNYCPCKKEKVCEEGYTTIRNHVGDWEYMSIRFQDSRPYSLYLPAIGADPGKDHSVFRWNGRTFQRNHQQAIKMKGNHPIVYAAKGSHELLPRVMKHTYKTSENGASFTSVTSSGRTWSTWKNLKIVKYKPNGGYSDEFKFLDYNGIWGNQETECFISGETAKECVRIDGPYGPQRRFIREGKLGEASSEDK